MEGIGNATVTTNTGRPGLTLVRINFESSG